MKVLLFEDKSIKNYILTAFSIFLFSFSAFGASFVVNSNSDDSDTNPADNLCLDANGNCTLRAAVQQSNALASNDVITFAAGLPTITFTTNTEIIVSNAGTLQINCPGANVLIINGGTSFDRIFKANAATVTFADLTLTDGGTNATFGGSDPIQDGGAILATGGSLTIQRVNITANYAGWGGGQSGIFGGGIVLNGGTHSIQNS
ncbi:MAG: hypothetical protein LH614_20965, partial [Pyrinomonadaceae bacterium]|nr:hypothetical protein [Pyrinomonadaceae bacterium]